MKYSEKMFNYGGNKFRYISTEPLEIGDEVIIENGSKPIIKPIIEIIEQRKDNGKWKEPKITNTIIVGV